MVIIGIRIDDPYGDFKEKYCLHTIALTVQVPSHHALAK